MTPQRVEEPGRPRSDQRRVRFDDDAREAGEIGSHRVVVVLGHRTRIEEAAGVVQLYLTDALARLVQGPARRGHLRRDRPSRRVAFGRVLPEIAHDAAPRTLAAGEEHRGDTRDRSVAGPLVLDEESLGAPRIVQRPGRTAVQDESISGCGG